MTTQSELDTLLKTPPFSTNDDLINWNASLIRLDAALEVRLIISIGSE